jgi:hypothetical protein
VIPRSPPDGLAGGGGGGGQHPRPHPPPPTPPTPFPDTREAADEVVGGDSQAALIPLAEQTVDQSLPILAPQPTQTQKCLRISSLDDQLLARSNDPGAITEECVGQRLGLPAMAVKDVAARVVHDATASIQDTVERVLVSSCLRRRPGVELRREHLAERQEPITAKHHVGSRSHRPAGSRRGRRPIKAPLGESAIESTLELKAKLRRGGKLVGEGRTGDGVNARIGEEPVDPHQPSWRRNTIIVRIGDHSADGCPKTGSSAVIEPASILSHVTRAMPEHQVTTVLIAGVVVDDDDLSRRRGQLGECLEKARKVVGASMSADEDRDGLSRPRRGLDSESPLEITGES